MLSSELERVIFFLFPDPSHYVYSYASGTYGCRAVADSFRYFQLEWPWGLEEMYVSVKELVSLVVAAALCFHSDNMAEVSTFYKNN